MSHPARGAWIETSEGNTNLIVGDIKSHPARGAWIETTVDLT